MLGRYHVRAERRLALLQADPQTKKFAEKPAAFAMAIDELSFQVVHSTPAQIEEVFHPYLAAVQDPKNPNPADGGGAHFSAPTVLSGSARQNGECRKARPLGPARLS